MSTVQETIKKAQFYIALRSGFAADHEVMKGLMPDTKTLREMIEGTDKPEITKESLFANFETITHVSRTSLHNFFEYKEFLEHLPTFIKELQDAGVEFTAQDFTEIALASKSALEMAEHAGKPEAILTPALWPGKMDEIEEMYSNLSATRQGSIEITELLRESAKAGGVHLRVDEIEDAGVTHENIRDACKNGDIGNIAARLESAGLALTKKDLFDARVWTEKEVWKHYDQIHAVLKRNNDVLSAEDFLQELHPSDAKFPKNTILKWGVEASEIALAMKPEHWVGRAQELEILLDKIPKTDRPKNKVDPSTVMSALVDQEYGEQYFGRDPSEYTLEEIISPIEPQVSLKAAFNNETDSRPRTPVTPLGVPSFWDDAEGIRRAMKKAGTPLTPEHLTTYAGYAGETGLTAALRQGKIRTVMNIYRDAGQTLTPATLQSADVFGDKAYDLLSLEDLQEIVFDPQYWVGKTDAMKALHESLQFNEKSKIDINEIIKGMNRAVLIHHAEKVEFDPFA